MTKNTAKSNGETHGKEAKNCGEHGCRGKKCRRQNKIPIVNRNAENGNFSNMSKITQKQTPFDFFHCLQNDKQKIKVTELINEFVLIFKINIHVNVNTHKFNNISNPELVSICFSKTHLFSDDLIQIIESLFNKIEIFQSKTKLMVLLDFSEINDDNLNVKAKDIIQELCNKLKLEYISIGKKIITK